MLDMFILEFVSVSLPLLLLLQSGEQGRTNEPADNEARDPGRAHAELFPRNQDPTRVKRCEAEAEARDCYEEPHQAALSIRHEEASCCRGDGKLHCDELFC